MRTGYNTIGITAIVVLILGSAALGVPPAGVGGPRRAVARRPSEGNRPGRLGTPHGIIRQLDLTEEQTEKIHAIVAESRAEAKTAGENLVQARQALHDAVADDAKQEEIQAAAKTLGEAIADQAMCRSRMWTSVKEVLTGEQRKQLEQARGPLGRSRGRMPGRGPRERSGRVQPRRWALADDGPVWSPRGGGPRRGDDRPAWSPRGGGPRWGDDGRRGGYRGRMAMRTPRGRGRLPLGRMFRGADTDDDHELSMEELDAFRGSVRTRRGSRRW